MFVTTKRFNWLMDRRDSAIQELQNKYYLLLRKHNLLLTHLGLTEVDVPAKTELRTKGRPEKSELGKETTRNGRLTGNRPPKETRRSDNRS